MSRRRTWEEGGAKERSEMVVAMREGTRNEKGMRWCGAIETDVNEDNVAPWRVNGRDSGGSCAEP